MHFVEDVSLSLFISMLIIPVEFGRKFDAFVLTIAQDHQQQQIKKLKNRFRIKMLGKQGPSHCPGLVLSFKVKQIDVVDSERETHLGILIRSKGRGLGYYNHSARTR